MATAPADWAPELSGRKACALLASYFVVQTLSRIWMGDAAELDESELLLLTQDWRWG